MITAPYVAEPDDLPKETYHVKAQVSPDRRIDGIMTKLTMPDGEKFKHCFIEVRDDALPHYRYEVHVSDVEFDWGHSDVVLAAFNSVIFRNYRMSARRQTKVAKLLAYAALHPT